jgi:hypothetical protein
LTSIRPRATVGLVGIPANAGTRFARRLPPHGRNRFRRAADRQFGIGGSRAAEMGK